jgi:Nucleotidyltransferase domain
VLVTGSYAKGTATEASDLDLVPITPAPREPYRTWFENRRPDPPLHVSAGSKTAGDWSARAASAARWSFGFPAILAAYYLWADDATRERLGDDPSLRYPAADPELEDFVEFVLKAKRSARSGDEIGLRWFAHSAAELAPTMLVPLNEERIVHDRRDALDAALGLGVAPEGYPNDMVVCLGLTSASGAEVREAVARLGSEIIRFVRKSAPEGQLPDYLMDGTLERHLDLIE